MNGKEHTCNIASGITPTTPCLACVADGDPFIDALMNGPCNMCGYRLADIDPDERERKELRAEVERLRSIALSGWINARMLAIAHGAAATEREANGVILDLERRTAQARSSEGNDR